MIITNRDNSFKIIFKHFKNYINIKIDFFYNYVNKIKAIQYGEESSNATKETVQWLFRPRPGAPARA